MNDRTRFALLLTLLVACDDPPPEPAQSRCGQNCAMVFDTLWRSDPDNPDLSMTFSPVERGDSLLVVNTYENKYVAVLGPRGETVRLIGRTGDGPGEYRSISAIAALADGKVYVFDRRRLTVLDSNLAVAFTASLPVTVEKAVVLTDGTSVTDGSRQVGDSTFALHRLGTDGQILNSFDGSGSAFTSRFIARGRDNTVWSAPRLQGAPIYQIDRWDPRNGHLLQSIRDTPAWMQWSAPDSTANEIACNRGDRSACDRMHDEPRPPRPRVPAIFHMWESAEGHLWILSFKADARWKEAARDDLVRQFDSVLEVRDAVSGELVLTREFDEYLTGFTNNGHVMMFRLDDADRPMHTLVRVGLAPGN